jgi:hypothetical protein
VEWGRAKARRARWWEEVLLTVEEMGRNLAYGRHARREWLRLAEQEHDDSLVSEGMTAYALERAAHELLRSAALVVKWTLVLDRAASSSLMQGLDVADMFKRARDAGDQDMEREDDLRGGGILVLHMPGLEGLAMSTDDYEYEPWYVPYPLLFHEYDANVTCRCSWS